MTEEMQRYLTPVEIAAVLSVKVKTVRGWLNNPNHPLVGTLVPGVGWRVTRQQFKAFVEAGNDRG
jgi:hypothetical protein